MIDPVAVNTWDDERVWPNFACTAALLHLDRSALTKQARLGRIRYLARGLGRGERIVPPIEVIRLARIYRRVPVDDVMDGLAGWMADRFLLDTDEVLLHLRQLAELADAREGADRPRVVKLGRLVPRKMDADEFPVPGLTEALAARRLAAPAVRVLGRKPQVVRLGRLRPGDRP
ncbi:MAG: hypothetical protein ACRDIY_03785 [Chloroflexota bacterium]